jgi:hypothetical protein
VRGPGPKGGGQKEAHGGALLRVELYGGPQSIAPLCHYYTIVLLCCYSVTLLYYHTVVTVLPKHPNTVLMPMAMAFSDSNSLTNAMS